MELQMIGAGLLVVALLLTWIRFDWIAIFVLGIVGILDIYLLKKHKMTISELIHNLFPRSMDITLMIILLATTWWLGPPTFLPVMVGVIIGHLLWSEG